MITFFIMGYHTYIRILTWVSKGSNRKIFLDLDDELDVSISEVPRSYFIYSCIYEQKSYWIEYDINNIFQQQKLHFNDSISIFSCSQQVSNWVKVKKRRKGKHVLQSCQRWWCSLVFQRIPNQSWQLLSVIHYLIWSQLTIIQ